MFVLLLYAAVAYAAWLAPCCVPHGAGPQFRPLVLVNFDLCAAFCIMWNWGTVVQLAEPLANAN